VALGTDGVALVRDANTSGRGPPGLPFARRRAAELVRWAAPPYEKRLDKEVPKVELCFARFGA